MASLGIVTILPWTRDIIEFAKATETAGFERIGLADTAPRLYHAVYPAITGSLLSTERLRVGAYVSNFVSQHWSVHGSAARALEELAPGRYFSGLATGDGAVHSVGLKPATLAEFETAVVEMRSIMPEQTDIHMAFSGPKGVEVAGRHATELSIGTGLDVGALRSLGDRAKAARVAAGNMAPLRMWTFTPTHIADSEADLPALRQHLRPLANAAARFALDFSHEGKNVPEDYQPIIKQGMKRYSHAYHGLAGDTPNAHIFDDYPHVQDYILDRMNLIGTASQVARRLQDAVEATGLDGVWLPISPTAAGGHAAHMEQLRKVTHAFGDFLGR